MDQLTKDCIAAQKAGMSYGKWKALQYKPPVVEVEPEPEEVHKVKQAPKRICRLCGAELPSYMHGLKRYCSEYCREERNRRSAKEYYHRKVGRNVDGKV